MAEAAAETGSAAAEKVQDKSSPAPNGAAPAVPLRIPMTFDRWVRLSSASRTWSPADDGFHRSSGRLTTALV